MTGISWEGATLKRGIALFREAGSVGRDSAPWPPVENRPIPDELVESARRTFGYQVLLAP